MNRKIWVRVGLFFALLVIGGSILAIYIYHEESREKVLELYIFNMKSGPAVFIRTPNDKRVLINGGSNSEIISLITKILPFYSRRIDILMVTNDSAKNVTGLIDILNRYDVGKVYIPALNLAALGLASSTDPIYQIFLETANEKNIPIGELSKRDIIGLDNGKQSIGSKAIIQDVDAKILFPATSTEFAYSKASAPELIMNIRYGSTSFFMLGTATTKIQKFIASQGTTTSDVLMVWNSASVDNLDAGLIEQIQPDYLVYSKSLTAAAPKAKTSSASSTSKSKKPKKIKIDPLGYLNDANRYNIKAFEYIKITSNGVNLRVESN